jgi:predicted metal-dependent hydrolase
VEQQSALQHLLKGVELFNAGDFFEAHEALEEAMEEAGGGPDWEFFLGLLRAAVANHKRTQGEISSAILHLDAALRFLAPYPDRHQGVKLRELRYALSRQVAKLRETREHGRSAASAPVPRIELV